MSPRRASAPSLTLGFFGSGTTSLKGATALVEDLIEANGFKARIVVPVTEDHWTEGIAAMADFAIDNGHVLEVVTDDTTAKFKSVKSYVDKASKQYKSAKAGTKIVSVVSDLGGKVIIFWDDENDETYDVIEAAADAGVDALDICAGLEKIELAPEDEAGEEAAPEPDPDEPEGDEEPISEDYLAGLEDMDIEALADTFGIDPEAYEDWDAVREAILVASRSEEGDQELATAGLEGELPTEDEVSGWDFDKLKAFAAEHDIEVAPRSRTSGYRTAVIGWLGQQDEEGYEPPEDEPLDLPAEVGEFDTDALAEAVAAALKAPIDNLSQMVGRLGMSVDKLTAEVNESYASINAALDTITKQRASSPAPSPQKPTRTPSAAAGATKKAVAPLAPQTAGEKVMAPVLKWVDADVVTKITATKILDLWAQRPKGRPTERERKLYALARSVIPEEKRPVGRPRKP